MCALFLRAALGCTIVPTVIKDKSIETDINYEFSEPLFNLTDCNNVEYKIEVYPGDYTDKILLQLTSTELNIQIDMNGVNEPLAI